MDCVKRFISVFIPQKTIKKSSFPFYTKDKVHLISCGQKFPRNFFKTVPRKDRSLLKTIYKNIQKLIYSKGVGHDSLICEIIQQSLYSHTVRTSICILFCVELENLVEEEILVEAWENFTIILKNLSLSKDILQNISQFCKEKTATTLPVVNKQVIKIINYIQRIIAEKTDFSQPMSYSLLNHSDIAHIRKYIYKKSMFGTTIQSVLKIQGKKFPDHKLPWILPTLANLMIEYGATSFHGIFRICGDIDLVMLTVRECECYERPSTCEISVLSSTLKLWFRQLAEPVIPHDLYDQCVDHDLDRQEIEKIVAKLPEENLYVLKYLIRFLRLFVSAESAEKTQMTASNMSIIMAPNILRPRDNSMAIIYTFREIKFVTSLLQSMYVDDVPEL